MPIQELLKDLRIVERVFCNAGQFALAEVLDAKRVRRHIGD